jgi:GntR family transcriptional regulator
VINRDPTPLYYQIKQQLKLKIERGELPPGTALPSERELIAQFGVSRPTVRQATQELLNEGLLERRRGIGTYVAQPKIRQSLASVLGFSERMEREGRRPSSKVIEQRVVSAVEAGGDVAAQLHVDPDASVLRLIRLRCADAEPILLETVHLPLDRFPSIDQIDFGQHSLYRVLRDQYDVEIQQLGETLEPVVLTKDQAALLHSEAGRPAMLAGITTFDQHGLPVERTLSLVRGDRCQYYIEFHVGEAQAGRAHLRQTHLEMSL